MNVSAIIQARMGSTRLPGKVLKDIGGQTMLARVIHRVKQAETLNQVIIATTKGSHDNLIVEEAERFSASAYRGSETDVLDRYYQAALMHKSDIVVRITSDCPLIDPEIIDKVVRHFLEAHPIYDYASNVIERTYPRGLDVEVVWLKVLASAWKNANETFQREHVTPFIHQNPEQFRLLSVTGGTGKEFRWTVDTPEDLAFMRAVYVRFNNSDNFSWREVIDLMKKEPELAEINKSIKQKDMLEEK